MKKLLKLLAVLLVLLVIAAISAPYLIPADTIKGTLIQKVEAATGRKITIDGALRFSFFPTVGVVVEKATLSNPKNSGDSTHFLSLTSLKVNVELVPLLSRKVVIHSFVLDNPVVNLHVYSNGAKNWEFTSSKSVPEPVAAPKEAGGSPSAMTMPGNIALNNIYLNNADITYVDDTKHTHIHLDKLSAKILNGKLTANVANADLYGGTVNASLVADSNAHPMTIESQMSLKDVALEPLLKDTANMDRLTGKLNLELNITSRGEDQQAIISELAGHGKLALSDGTIKRVNILDMFSSLQGGGSQLTTFSEMGGTFTITKGIVSNQDLKLQMTTLMASGAGDINLPAYTINYRLTPQVMGKAQNGTATGGVGIPVLIQGSLNDPKIGPDAASLLQNAINDPKQFREQLKNNERSAKEAVKNPKEVLKNLKGLFKGLQGN